MRKIASLCLLLFLISPLALYGANPYITSSNEYSISFFISSVTDSLEHQYTFEDSNNDATILVDSRANEDGSINSMNYSTSTAKVGNQSGTFPGTGVGVNFSDGGTLETNILQDEFSITFWIYMPDSNYGQSEVIFSNYDALDGIYYDVRSDNSLRFREWATDETVVYNLNTNTLATQTWHHIAITRSALEDGTAHEIELYVNGSEVATDSIGEDFTPDSSGSPELGSADGTAPFHGYIDSFRVYTKILSSTEVNDIYNNEN